MNDLNQANQGWVCPKCGRALAPWMSECPCNTMKTMGSSGMPLYQNEAGPDPLYSSEIMPFIHSIDHDNMGGL